MPDPFEILDWISNDFWGDENENERSIGFELEGYAKDNRPQTQLDRLVERCKFYIDRYNIKIDRVNIVGHYQLSSDRSDPGASFPWDSFIEQLKRKEFELSADIYEEFFKAANKDVAVNKQAGIYQSWLTELKAGRNKGAALNNEYTFGEDAYQFFTGGIAVWSPATNKVVWF